MSAHAGLKTSSPAHRREVDALARALFEPLIDERFEALEMLHAAGLSTFAVVQPLLPMDAGGARLSASARGTSRVGG